MSNLPDGIRIESQPLSPAGAAEWDALLGKASGGTFYHRQGWQQVNGQQLRHETLLLQARDASGALVGALPLVLVSSRLFGRILCSMPFVNFGGPVSDSPAIDTALCRAAMARADELKVDCLELRCARPVEIGLEPSLKKISMTLQLAADPEVLWNGFTSKHRNNIKRAFKNGLEVKSGGKELLQTFHDVMAQSWRNLGTPLYRRSYFEAILDRFPEDTRIFLCHRQDEPVAVALNGYHNGVVEGMWAGGTAQARRLDSNYVLYWEMMRDACLRGCQHYHLGRSTADSGGEEYKRKWNAEATQLYWYNYLPGGGSRPELNVDNPKYRLAIATWQRLPLWLTGLLGPPVARLIP